MSSPNTPDPAPRERTAAAVDRVASAMSRAHSGPFGLTPGDLAALRRGPKAAPSTFWRVFTQLVEPSLSPEGPASEQEAMKWPAILQILALLEGLHARNARLGTALALAGLSDLRFERLMRANGDRLVDEAVKAARLLASKAQPADLFAFAQLLRHQDDEAAETIRRRVARDYFHTLHQNA